MPLPTPQNSSATELRLETGAIWWGRLRLESAFGTALEEGPWIATDLRTGIPCLVERFPSGFGGALTSAEEVYRLIAAGAAAAHPDLLPCYRAEGVWPDLVMVSASHPLLQSGSLLDQVEAAAAQPDIGLTWINSLAHVLQELQSARLPSHGAIVPSRLAVNPDGGLVLTGYPYAAYFGSPENAAFFREASAAAGASAAPSPADDLFALSALSYFILTGGARPGLENASSPSISEARAARNLPVLPWPGDWTSNLMSALQRDPSTLALTVRDWIEPLNRAAGREALAGPLGQIAPLVPVVVNTLRRPPRWRMAGLTARSLSAYSASPNELPTRSTSSSRTLRASSANDPAAQAPANADDSALKERAEALRRQEAALEQKSQLLELDRQEVDRMIQAASAPKAEAAARTDELEKQWKTLKENHAALNVQRREVEAQVLAHRAAQEALRAEQATAAKRGADLANAQKAIEAQKQQIAKDSEQIANTERALKQRATELEAREKPLKDLQAAFTRLTGSDGVAQWQTFVQRLQATQADLERRTAQLLKEKKQLETATENFRRISTHASASGSTEAEPAAQELSGSSESLGGDQNLNPSSAAEIPSVAADGPADSAVIPEVSSGPSTPPPPPPSSMPPPSPPSALSGVINKATLAMGTGGRRLHLFAGPALRFGRQAESDVLLIALQGGQASPNLGLNREFSRKHFELTVSNQQLRVLDGWSDDGKPSQHGVCLDGRRVPPSGAEVRHGTLLSVTTRAPARTVPHWKVSLLHRTDRGSKSAISAVFLQRLDDAPDDLLLLLDHVALKEIGFESWGDLALSKQALGFSWDHAGQLTPLLEGPGPVPNIAVLSLGYTSPSIVSKT